MSAPQERVQVSPDLVQFHQEAIAELPARYPHAFIKTTDSQSRDALVLKTYEPQGVRNNVFRVVLTQEGAVVLTTGTFFGLVTPLLSPIEQYDLAPLIDALPFSNALISSGEGYHDISLPGLYGQIGIRMDGKRYDMRRAPYVHQTIFQSAETLHANEPIQVEPSKVTVDQLK